MQYVFKEVQKFTQWWLWLILLSIATLFAFAIKTQLIDGNTFGNQPVSDELLVVLATFSFVLVFLFLILKLKLNIDHRGIRMYYFPFIQKEFKWSEIESLEIIDYGMIGGWGMRPWTSYGRVYSVKGRMGLSIKTKSGESFVIGTQRPDEVQQVVHNFTSK